MGFRGLWHSPGLRGRGGCRGRGTGGGREAPLHPQADAALPHRGGRRPPRLRQARTAGTGFGAGGGGRPGWGVGANVGLAEEDNCGRGDTPSAPPGRLGEFLPPPPTGSCDLTGQRAQTWLISSQHKTSTSPGDNFLVGRRQLHRILVLDVKFRPICVETILFDR